MKAIVAVDRNWGIGRDGRLLVHLPGDLKYFKEKTKGKVVVMGRATLESLPGGKPLKDRVNIVLSRNEKYDADCSICHSREDLFEIIKRYDEEDVYIIGGEDVYRQFLPYCDVVYVTKIAENFPADNYFENLEKHPQWMQVWESEQQEEKGIKYVFTEYRRSTKGKAKV
ncbi:MAG: dihydrofolate reductase [Anaerovoracaceae bacterium]